MADETTRNLQKKTRRPKLGLSLLALGGLFIIWMPLILYLREFAHFSMAFGGVVIGLIVLGCAVLGWIFPERVQIFGAVGIVFSILSLMGAFGGMIIGMNLGLVGGCLCLAWGPKPQHYDEREKKTRFSLRERLSRTKSTHENFPARESTRKTRASHRIDWEDIGT